MNAKSNQKQTGQRVRNRPAFLRALGSAEPPQQITIDGRSLDLQQIYKHDSWAATARYERDGFTVVCKINRTQPCFGIPLRWLGRWLASREASFFQLLDSVPGIPKGFASVEIDGQVDLNAFAHAFIPGRPLSLVHNTNAEFFDQLIDLISTIHSHQMAYVDLNKPENVLVGDDGRPYLFDFQISLRLPDWPVARWLLKMFQQSDRYHLMKHRTWRLNRAQFDCEMDRYRPWWIRWHRTVGVPLRSMRRQLLVWLRIRKGQGAAHTEVAPEHGLCTAEKVAANKRAA